MSDKVIYVMYDDDGVLKDGAKKLVSKGIKIADAFSPFPIHGIDPIIGVRKTRLAICAFIYGLIGMSLALTGMWFFMIEDWPMNIGGKPNYSMLQNIPAFIPITFELTVLCTAHGMAITYFLRNKTLPGMVFVSSISNFFEKIKTPAFTFPFTITFPPDFKVITGYPIFDSLKFILSL